MCRKINVGRREIHKIMDYNGNMFSNTSVRQCFKKYHKNNKNRKKNLELVIY